MAKKKPLTLKLDTMQVDIAEERSNVYHVGVAMTWQIPKRPKYFGASYKARVSAVKGKKDTFKISISKSTGGPARAAYHWHSSHAESACEATVYDMKKLCSRDIRADADEYMASQKKRK